MSKQMVATGRTRRTPTGTVLELVVPGKVIDMTEYLMAKKREREQRGNGGEAA